MTGPACTASARTARTGSPASSTSSPPTSDSAIVEAWLIVSLTPIARPRSAGATTSVISAEDATLTQDQPTPTRNVPSVMTRYSGEVGLSELEILDIAQAAAFFSWANRLMLTLGDEYYPDEASA